MIPAAPSCSLVQLEIARLMRIASASIPPQRAGRPPACRYSNGSRRVAGQRRCMLHLAGLDTPPTGAHHPDADIVLCAAHEELAVGQRSPTETVAVASELKLLLHWAVRVPESMLQHIWRSCSGCLQRGSGPSWRHGMAAIVDWTANSGAAPALAKRMHAVKCLDDSFSNSVRHQQVESLLAESAASQTTAHPCSPCVPSSRIDQRNARQALHRCGRGFAPPTAECNWQFTETCSRLPPTHI